MKKSIKILIMIMLIAVLSCTLLACKKSGGGMIDGGADSDLNPIVNMNKNEIMRYISDGMVTGGVHLENSPVRYVNSVYTLHIGEINYTVTYMANYAEKRQESEIYLKIFDNHVHANRIFIYYHKGNLFVESMYGKQRLDNFGSSTTFDLLYEVLTIFDATNFFISESSAALFDPDNVGGSLVPLVDQERISHIKVTENSDSIEMTDVNLNYGQIKNVINQAIKDTFSPFEKKLDLLSLKYLGLRISDLAILEISTAECDLINVRLTNDSVDTIVMKASGAMADGINNFYIDASFTARPGTGVITVPDHENPYLDAKYKEMLLGHYNYKGILTIPALDAEYTATFRAILSSTDNTANKVAFTIENIATKELEGGLYYKDQILYADISGIQRTINAGVQLEKLNLPKVSFSGFNLAQELTLLINNAIRLVQSASGEDVYGQNKELLQAVLDNIVSDEANSTIYITITKELLQTFSKNSDGDFVVMLAEKLGIDPALLKQLLGEDALENARLVISYNVDTGRIGISLYDGEYLVFSLFMDKVDPLPGNVVAYPASFRPIEYLEFKIPSNTIISMTGKLSMMEVNNTDFSKLFGALMGDITGLNTVFKLRSDEVFNFTLDLMQEYEYITREDGSVEQKIYQTLKFELYKAGAFDTGLGVLVLGVYADRANPDYLFVNFNVPIGPEGTAGDGKPYEKRSLKYRILRTKVVESFNELLGEENIFATPNIMDVIRKLTNAIKGSQSMKLRFTDAGLTFNLHKEPIKELIGIDNLYANIGLMIKFATASEEKLVINIAYSEYALPSISPLESQVTESIYKTKWYEYAYVYFTADKINPMLLKLSFSEASTKITSGRYYYQPEAKLLGEKVGYHLRISDEINGTKLVSAIIDPNTPENASAIVNALNAWFIDPTKTTKLPSLLSVLYDDGMVGEVGYRIEGFDQSNITLAGMVDARYIIIIGEGSIAELRFMVSIGVLGRVIKPLNDENSYPQGAPVVGEVLIDPYTYAVKKAENSKWSPLPDSLTLKFEELPKKSRTYKSYLEAVLAEAKATFLPLAPDATPDVILQRENEIKNTAWTMAYTRTITPEDLLIIMHDILISYGDGEVRYRAWNETMQTLDTNIITEDNIKNEFLLTGIVWDFDYSNIRYNGGFFFTHAYFNNVVIALKVFVKSKVVQYIQLVDSVNISLAEKDRPFTEAAGIYTVDVLDTSSYVFPTSSTAKQQMRIYFTDGTYRIIGTADHTTADEIYYNTYLPIAIEWKHPNVITVRQDGAKAPLGEADKALNTAPLGTGYTVGIQTLNLTIFEPGRTAAGVGNAETISAVTGYERNPNTNEYDFDRTTVEWVSPTKASFIAAGTTYGDFYEINPYKKQPLPTMVYILVEQGGTGRMQRKGYPVTWVEDDILVRDEYGKYWLRNVSLTERYLRVRGVIGDGTIKLNIVMIVHSLSAQYQDIVFQGLEQGVKRKDIDPYQTLALPSGFSMDLGSGMVIGFDNVTWTLDISGFDLSNPASRWVLQFFGKNYSWLPVYTEYKEALANGYSYPYTLNEIIPAGMSEPTAAEYAYFLSCIIAQRIPLNSLFTFPPYAAAYTALSPIAETENVIAQEVALTLNILSRELSVSVSGTLSDILHSEGNAFVEKYVLDTYEEASYTMLQKLEKLSAYNTKYALTVGYLDSFMTRKRWEDPALTQLQIAVLAYNDFIARNVPNESDRLLQFYNTASGSTDDEKKSYALGMYRSVVEGEISETAIGFLLLNRMDSTQTFRYNLSVYWENIDELIRILKMPSGREAGFILTGYIGYGKANSQKVEIRFDISRRVIQSFYYPEINNSPSSAFTIDYSYAVISEFVTAIEDQAILLESLGYTAIFNRLMAHPLISDADVALLNSYFSSSSSLTDELRCKDAVTAFKAYRGEPASSLLRNVYQTVMANNNIAAKYTNIFSNYYNGGIREQEKIILDKLYASFASISNQEARYEATVRKFIENRASNASKILIEMNKPMGLTYKDASGADTGLFISPSDYYKKALELLTVYFENTDKSGDYNPQFMLASNFDALILATSAEAVTVNEPGGIYSYVNIILRRLSTGSCENPVAVSFRSVVDSVKGLYKSVEGEEREPYDEKGSPKYADGYKLPAVLAVEYNKSGTVLFGNIAGWTVESNVPGYSSGDVISSIPATAINVLNPYDSMKLKYELPCNQGEYLYSVGFPYKYIGKTNYDGRTSDRNYSMLDINNGVITINDIYSIYQTGGISTAQFILQNLPQVITAMGTSYSDGILHKVNAGDPDGDGIPTYYEITLNNSYEVAWHLVNASVQLDSNGTNGNLLFATAQLYSYYFYEEDSLQPRQLTQTIELYINVKKLETPVLSYSGLADAADNNAIKFDPYDVNNVYNGNLTLPIDGLTVYFNGSSSGDSHTFAAGDKISYYLRMQDIDVKAQSLLYQTLLAMASSSSSGLYSPALERTMRRTYFDALLPIAAQNIAVTLSDMSRTVMSASFDALLKGDMFDGANLVSQRAFMVALAGSILNTAQYGFSYSAAYDAFINQPSLTDAKRIAVLTEYLRTRNVSDISIVNDIFILKDIFNYLKNDLDNESTKTMIGNVVARIFNSFTVGQKAVFKRTIQNSYSSAMAAAQASLGTHSYVGDELDAAVFDAFLTGRDPSQRLTHLTEYMATLANTADKAASDPSNTLSDTAAAFAFVMLFNAALPAEVQVIMSFMNERSIVAWPSLGAQNPGKYDIFKANVWISYLNMLIRAGGSVTELASAMDIYFSLSSSMSKDRAKELVAGYLYNSYNYSDINQYFISVTPDEITALRITHIKIFVEAAEFAATGNNDGLTWILNKARMAAWDTIASTLTAVQFRNLYNNTVSNAGGNTTGLLAAAYGYIINDSALSDTFKQQLRSLTGVGGAGEPSDTGKAAAIQNLFGLTPSFSVSVREMAVMIKHIFIIANNISETERFVTSIPYTQAGHSISEIDGSILQLYMRLPDGKIVEFTLEIFKRDIRLVMMENKITTDGNATAQAPAVSAVNIPGVYYIDPYNSDTFVLPGQALFTFESGTDLLLPIKAWIFEGSAVDKFYSRSDGIYYYRLDENSYKGGFYTVKSYLTYGTGDSVELQYFEILIIVLNRSLSVAYNDSYKFDDNTVEQRDGPIGGRVKDLPNALTEEMFVSPSAHYGSKLRDLVDAYAAKGIHVSYSELAYETFGTPVLPEIIWEKTSYNANGVSDNDIEIAGGFEKDVTGYLASPNWSLNRLYMSVWQLIYADYAKYAKPGAWERLFEVNGDVRTVKSNFTGSIRSSISSYDTAIFETLYIQSWQELEKAADASMEEAMRYVSETILNNPSLVGGNQYNEYTTGQFILFYNVLKSKAALGTLNQFENTVWTALKAQYSLLAARNIDSLRISAWNSLYASVTDPAYKTVLNKYLSDEYAKHYNSMLVSTWDEVFIKVNEKDAAVMTEVLNILIKTYGDTPSGIVNAKVAAWPVVLLKDKAKNVWGETAHIDISADTWTLLRIYSDYLTQKILSEIDYNHYAGSGTFDSYETAFEVLDTILLEKLAAAYDEQAQLSYSDYKALALDELTRRLAEAALVRVQDIEELYEGYPTGDERNYRVWDALSASILASAQSPVDEALAMYSQYLPSVQNMNAWNSLYGAADTYWKGIMDAAYVPGNYEASVSAYRQLRINIFAEPLVAALTEAYGKAAPAAWDTINTQVSNGTYNDAANPLTATDMNSMFRLNTAEKAWIAAYNDYSTLAERTTMFQYETLNAASPYKYVLAWDAYINELERTANTSRKTLLERVYNYYLKGYHYIYPKLLNGEYALSGETPETIKALQNYIAFTKYPTYAAGSELVISDVIEKLTAFYGAQMSVFTAEYTAVEKTAAWTNMIKRYSPSVVSIEDYMRTYIVSPATWKALPARQTAAINLNAVKSRALQIYKNNIASTDKIKQISTVFSLDAYNAILDEIMAEAIKNDTTLTLEAMTDEFVADNIWYILREKAGGALKAKMDALIRTMSREENVNPLYPSSEFIARAYARLLAEASATEKAEILAVYNLYTASGARALLWDRLAAKYPASSVIGTAMDARLSAVMRQEGVTDLNSVNAAVVASIKEKAWAQLLEKTSNNELKAEMTNTFKTYMDARRYELTLSLASLEAGDVIAGYEKEIRGAYRKNEIWAALYATPLSAELDIVFAAASSYYGDMGNNILLYGKAFDLYFGLLPDAEKTAVCAAYHTPQTLEDILNAVDESFRLANIGAADAVRLAPSAADTVNAKAQIWNEIYYGASSTLRTTMTSRIALTAANSEKAAEMDNSGFRTILVNNGYPLASVDARIAEAAAVLRDTYLSSLGVYIFMLRDAVSDPGAIAVVTSAEQRYTALYNGGLDLTRVEVISKYALYLKDSATAPWRALFDAVKSAAKTQNNIKKGAWDIYASAYPSEQSTLLEILKSVSGSSGSELMVKALDALYRSLTGEAASEVDSIKDGLVSAIKKSDLWKEIFGPEMDSFKNMLNESLAAVTAAVEQERTAALTEDDDDFGKPAGITGNDITNDNLIKYLSWQKMFADFRVMTAYNNKLAEIDAYVGLIYSPGTAKNAACWVEAYANIQADPQYAGLRTIMSGIIRSYTDVNPGAPESMFHSAAWLALISYMNGELAAKAALEAVYNGIRGDTQNIPATVYNWTLLSYQAAYAAYSARLEKASQEIRAAAYSDFAAKFSLTNLFASVLADIENALMLSEGTEIGSFAAAWDLFAGTARYIDASFAAGNTVRDEEGKIVLAFDCLLDSLTGEAYMRLLNAYESKSAQADGAAYFKSVYDILYANVSPSKKEKLRAFLLSEGSEEAALAAYALYKQNAAVSTVTGVMARLGLGGDYQALSDAQKRAVYDGLQLPKTVVKTFNTIDKVEGLWAAGNTDAAEGNNAIFWDDISFTKEGGQGDSALEIGNVYVGNAYKDIGQAFAVPNIRYRNIQLIITHLDFYGELDLTTSGSKTFYNEYLVDPLGDTDYTKAQADAYYFPPSGGEAVFIGRVNVKFDSDIRDIDVRAGAYSRIVTATVMLNGLEDAKINVTVHYLDRIPSQYYVLSQNYTSRPMDPETEMYPLEKNASGRFIIRIDPVNEQLFDAASKTYRMPTALGITFSTTYAADSLPASLAAAGRVNQSVSISGIAWNLQGKTISLTGFADSPVTITTYDINDKNFTSLPSMTQDFWRLLLTVENRTVSAVYSLTQAGGSSSQLAVMSGSRMVYDNGVTGDPNRKKVDPYNYEKIFARNILLQFTGGGSGKEILDIEWKYYPGRGQDFLKLPQVITGEIGEDNMYIIAGFDFMGETVWIDFPITPRHIDISSGGGQIRYLDGGTLYILAGGGSAEYQLAKYSSLYYNFADYGNPDDWTSVPLVFSRNSVTRINTLKPGIYTNIEGTLGPINDPNIYFTVIVIDPKLYLTDSSGNANEKVYYDKLVTAVSITGSRNPGKESESGFIPGRFLQLPIVGDENIVEATLKEFKIRSVDWDVANRVVRFICEYTFATEENDYMLLCSSYSKNAGGQAEISRMLTFVMEIPLETYVNSRIDDTLSLDMTGENKISLALGSVLKSSDLPKGIMNKGREGEIVVPLLWDLSEVNMNRAGTYNVYGYYMDYASFSVSRSKHLIIEIGKKDISSNIEDMYGSAHIYTGLNILFVPVVPAVLRDTGLFAQLNVGTEIIIEYITKARYLAGDFAAFRTTPYKDAGEYYVRVRINDYNVSGEKIFMFNILPIEISASDIGFEYGPDANNAEMNIPNWPQTQEEKDRMYYNQYRLEAERNDAVTVNSALPKSTYIKSQAYRTLFNDMNSIGQGILNARFDLIWKALHGSVDPNLSAEINNRREVEAIIWDSITPDGFAEISLLRGIGSWTVNPSTKISITIEAEAALTSEGKTVTPAAAAERAYTILFAAARDIFRRAMTARYDSLIADALRDAETVLLRSETSPSQMRITAKAVDMLRNYALSVFKGMPDFAARINAYGLGMSAAEITAKERLLLEEAARIVVWSEINENGFAATRLIVNWPVTETEKTALLDDARAALTAEGQTGITDDKVRIKAYDILMNRVPAAISGLMLDIVEREIMAAYPQFPSLDPVTQNNNRQIITREVWNSISGYSIGKTPGIKTLAVPAWKTGSAQKESMLDAEYVKVVNISLSQEAHDKLRKDVKANAYNALYASVYATAKVKLEGMLNTLIYAQYPDFENLAVTEKAAITLEMKALLWDRLVPGDTVTDKNYIYDERVHMPEVTGMPQVRIYGWPQSVEEKAAMLTAAKNENLSFTDAQAKARAFDKLSDTLIANSNIDAQEKLAKFLAGILTDPKYAGHDDMSVPADTRAAIIVNAKAEAWETLPVGENALVEEVNYTFEYRYTDMSNKTVISQTMPVAAGRYEIILHINEEQNRNYRLKEGDEIRTAINIDRANVILTFKTSMVYTGAPILPIIEALHRRTDNGISGNDPRYDNLFMSYALPAGVTITYTFFNEDTGAEVPEIRNAGRYRFNAVINGGNNYPSAMLTNVPFEIEKRKMLIEVGTVSGNYLEPINKLNGAVKFTGKSQYDTVASFGEIVCSSVVTSRHTVGVYPVKFVGFRKAGSDTVYYLNPVGTQKGVNELNAQLFGNYDITVADGSYEILKANPKAVFIDSRQKLLDEYDALTEKSNATWYLADADYGDFIMDKDVSITIIGCYDVNTIGAIDGIENNYDIIKAAAPLIATRFNSITVHRGALSVDIIAINGRLNSSAISVKRNAGYVYINRSGFIHTVQTDPITGDPIIQNAMAVNIEAGYSKRVSIRDTYFEQFTAAVQMNYLNVNPNSDIVENNLEIINCRFNRNSSGLIAYNGNIHIEDTRFEYSTRNAVYLDTDIFTLMDCEFIGNYTGIVSRKFGDDLYELSQNSEFIDNIYNVSGI